MHRSGDARYRELARQYGIVLSGIEERAKWLNPLIVHYLSVLCSFVQRATPCWGSCLGAMMLSFRLASIT